MVIRLKKPKAPGVCIHKGCSLSPSKVHIRAPVPAWSYLVRSACGTRVLDIKIRSEKSHPGQKAAKITFILSKSG